MPGPLPKASGRRRTNAPTIPTTELPAGGLTAPPPSVPRWIKLGSSGRAWWKWAWQTPQAAAWSAGHVAALARRAELEDDLAALADIEGLDFSAMENAEQARSAVAAVSRLATGKLALVKEMREMDDRFGLTPKAMAALRWQIVADKEPAEQKPATIRRLQAVDSAAG